MNDIVAMLTPLRVGVAFFLFMSTACAVLMLWDKLCAIKGRRRVPERALLLWAFFGGAVGGKLGQFLFRHKTRKEPFQTWMNVHLLWNVMVYTAGLFAVGIG